MAAPTDMQHEKRPGVYVFRNRFSRRERKWWMFGCACLVLLLNSAALTVWRQPDLSLDVKADWAVGLHALSWFPILLCFVACISPQFILRVSPRGVAYANTRWACLPWTRRRWHVQWWEIDRLNWGLARCEFKVRGRKRIVQCSIFRKQQRQVNSAISLYLGDWFDLTQGTAAQRWARQWKQVSLWRKALDKVLLLFVGANYYPIVAMWGFGQGNALVLTAGLILWLAAIVVLISQQRHYRSFGWQDPIHTLAQNDAAP